MARAQRTVYKRSSSNAPGRRFYDGSTKRVIAAGVGGGSVIGVLVSVFAFMNSAPWASKTDMEAIRLEIKRCETAMESHINSPGHSTSLARMATVEERMASMQETLREIKSDVKDIKDRQKK